MDASSSAPHRPVPSAPAMIAGNDEFWRLAGLTVAPVILFALVAVTALALRDADLREASLARAAATFMADIDTAFAGQTAGLLSLSASRALDRDDLNEFYAEAVRVVEMQHDWLTTILSEPATGQQLINTLRPPGATLPVFPDMESHARVVRERAPVVVSRPQAVGPVSQQPVYGLRVPVMRDGAVKYVLSATFTPAFIEDLLRRSPLPADVEGFIVNEDGRLLARIAAGGRVTLATGKTAVPVSEDEISRVGAMGSAPLTRWAVYLSRSMWSQVDEVFRRLWPLAAAGVMTSAVGLLSLFGFLRRRKSAEWALEARVAARTRELAEAAREKDVLVEELHHRVNNNLQIISSLVRMQERATKDPVQVAPLRLLRERLTGLFMVHGALARIMRDVEIGHALQRISDAALGSQGLTTLAGEGATVRRDPAVILGFALSEFLRSGRNADDSVGHRSRVTIDVARQEENVRVTVTEETADRSPVPMIPREREELIVLLADQGRGMARIENKGSARRLTMHVRACDRQAVTAPASGGS